MEPNKQDGVKYLVHASTASAAVGRLKIIFLPSSSNLPPASSSSVSDTASSISASRPSLWSSKMSWSRRSLVDDILDSKEEEFISVVRPGKNKAPCLRRLVTMIVDAENDKDNYFEDVNGAKVQQRTRHPVSPSYSKRSSSMTPSFAAFAVSAAVREDSAASGSLPHASFKEDCIAHDNAEDILQPLHLPSESISSLCEDCAAFQCCSSRDSSSSSHPSEDDFVGLTKFQRSSAIRDSDEMDVAIEAFWGGLRKHGEDHSYR